MNRAFLLACLCGALCGAQVALADIHRWVDDRGETHYSDRQPPPGIDAETVVAPIGAPARAQREDYEKLNAEFEERHQARLETEEKSAEAAAAAEKDRYNCDQARKRAAALERPRINTIDADGNRTRMPEEWRLAQLAEARAAVEKFCQ